MLALAHVLATEGLADRDFLDTYCTGYDRFERYLLGADDGVPKSPQWASAICGLPADDLTALARRMAGGPHDGHRQLVAAADPARRAGPVDGADPGRDARPDRASRRRFRARLRLDERAGPGAAALPAARAAAGPQPGVDVHPGGRRQRHAAAPRRGVRLQRAAADLSRHQAACTGPAATRSTTTRTSRGCAARWPRPDTIVVHDPYWTAMAKHADIVVPSTTAYERDDYSGSRNDPLLMAMPALAEPYAAVARRLHHLRRAAERLGFGEQFTEGRTAMEWLVHLYEKWSAGCGFRRAVVRRVLGRRAAAAAHRDRADPARRLPRRPGTRIGWTPRAGASRSSRPTSTGSATTTARATRRGSSPPNGSAVTRADRYPLHLLANQPATRLHSQLDGGGTSQKSKVQGREPIRIIPPTPRTAAWPTATWCGCSTTAAPAWPAS